LESNRIDKPFFEDWSSWLAGDGDIEQERRIRERTHTGRPCGDDEFVKKIETAVGRPLSPGKPGPKARVAQSESQIVLWTNDEISS
jgi:hypothetical protein